MRLGLVSDIHCNIAGLRKALDLMGPIDQLWCPGDTVFQFRWSNEVVGLLRDIGARVVLGNHEEVILGRDGERALSSPAVNRDLVAWLRTQPWNVDEVVGGKRVLMTHSSPWEPWREYHYPHSATWARAKDLEYDTVIVGHTHCKMADRFGTTLVINPGSAGDPRDHRNGYLLSCATWDTATDAVTFFDYPDPTRISAEAPG